MEPLVSSWYSVDDLRPEWVEDVLAGCAGMSDALASVHRDHDAWRRAHPVPANAHAAAVELSLNKQWLCSPAMEVVRAKLLARGFRCEGEPPSRDPELAALGDRIDVKALDRRPWPLTRPVAAGVARACGAATGYQAEAVDAWHPTEAIAVMIEWDPEPQRYVVEQVARYLTIDARYVVVARQAEARNRTRSYDLATRVLAGVFRDEDAKRKLRRRLPVRGALVIAI